MNKGYNETLIKPLNKDNSEIKKLNITLNSESKKLENMINSSIQNSEKKIKLMENQIITIFDKLNVIEQSINSILRNQ